MSKFPKFVPLTAALIGAAVFGCVVFRLLRANNAPPVIPSEVATESRDLSSSSPTSSILQLPPIDATQFLDRPEYRRIRSREIKTISIKGRAIAGVVNHHVLATDFLVNFFRALANNRPDATRIVILSPDHFYKGKSMISTHSRPYTTPSGSVEIDNKAVQDLISQQFAIEENGSMYELEHGIGALVPFMKDEFPNTKLIPISIRGNADREAVVKLGKALQSLDDGHTLFIISADMSHYLSKEVALKNDEKTRTWLQTTDAEAMMKATDDYTDSGRQFVALFTWFKFTNKKPAFIELDYGISTDYAGPENNTTSYLNGVWVE